MKPNAKRCFCGCGRTIGRFPLGIRSMNGRGRQVEERLAWGRALAAGAEEPTWQEWFEEGEEIVAALAAAMHGDVDPHQINPDWVGHWQKYGRGIELVTTDMGLPSIKLWLAAGRPALYGGSAA